MKTVRSVTCCFLLFFCSVALLGCAKKADESKPIGEVKAEAEKMDNDQLRSMAMQYKEAIIAKKGELEKLAAKLKDIKVTEALGTEAKQIKVEIDNINTSVSALKERFEVYYQKLKEKGGDTSGLEI